MFVSDSESLVPEPSWVFEGYRIRTDDLYPKRNMETRMTISH